jgi:hypothetical protein
MESCFTTFTYVGAIVLGFTQHKLSERRKDTVEVITEDEKSKTEEIIILQKPGGKSKPQQVDAQMS